jgi:hypothetical protein
LTANGTPATSSIASRPNALPAMNSSFCATASCLPIGRPHCTRSVDHSRAIFVANLVAPTALAVSASRPVFSVLSAIRRPSPSRATRFSSGTNTSSPVQESVRDAAVVHYGVGLRVFRVQVGGSMPMAWRRGARTVALT